MKDRITQFLKSEGISPAEFADKIGVQRSSVSHVLNGRNYPSASFIQKMLTAYRTLNSRWLLLGEGAVFESKSRVEKEPVLFEDSAEQQKGITVKNIPQIESNSLKDSSNPPLYSTAGKITPLVETIRTPDVEMGGQVPDLSNYLTDNKEFERIVIFFKDKTFEVYRPSK